MNVRLFVELVVGELGLRWSMSVVVVYCCASDFMVMRMWARVSGSTTGSESLHWGGICTDGLIVRCWVTRLSAVSLSWFSISSS